MWVLSWKKYGLSKFATFVSIVGALVRYAGVLCLFSGVIPAALICIAIGIAIHFVAEAIAKSKRAKMTGTKTSAAAKTMPQNKSIPQTQTPAAAPTTAAAPTAGSSVRCTTCGALFSAENKFCSKCGGTLSPLPPQEKRCLRCGAAVAPNSRFCPKCGYEIK